MKKYIKFAALAAILSLNSCSDSFLESEPYNQKETSNFFKTPTDAFESLVSVYDMLQYESFGGSTLLLSEIASDNCFAGFGSDDSQSDLEIDRFQNITDRNKNEDLYKNSYKGIYRANFLLENLDKVNWGKETALKTRYEAEAKFLRAHFHFQLIKMYGSIVTQSKTISDINGASLSRDLPEVTYALIASDLKFAADNLDMDNYSKKDNPNFGRITKWAAESYLARVFLFYTDYYEKPDLAGVVTKAQAITYINDVVNNSGHDLLPDFSKLWLAASLSDFAGEDNTEMVWSIRFNQLEKGKYDRNEGNRMQVLIATRNGVIGRFGNGWGGATVNPKLYNAYGVGDTRRDATIIAYKDDLTIDPNKKDSDLHKNGRDIRQFTGYAWKKYCPITSGPGKTVTDVVENGGDFQINNYEDIIVIRFADVLLMAAELNLTSNATFAKTCFDRVRTRAYKGATAPAVALTKSTIMEERRLELALEGSRYFDLIRQDMATAKAAIDEKDGKVDVFGVSFNTTFDTATLGWFPLPQTQISLSNGAIKQNPGWN